MTTWPGPHAVGVEGRTAVVVAWDGEARAVLVVSGTVKPTSVEATGQ